MHGRGRLRICSLDVLGQARTEVLFGGPGAGFADGGAEAFIQLSASKTGATMVADNGGHQSPSGGASRWLMAWASSHAWALVNG